MTVPDVYLDAQIRNWVLVPISLTMFVVGVLRHFVNKLMTRTDVKVELKSIREAQCVLRSQRLRANVGYIPHKAFRAKRHFFTNKENGVLNEKIESVANPMSPMGMPGGQPADPSMLVDMMKKNLGMVVPQMLIYNWVTFFFSGFVVAKVPFPLTMRFRSMLQRGIDVNSLDITYVSSLSWYFLNLFGMRGLFTLVLGENTVDDTAIMQQQMTMGMNGADPSKAYQIEKDNIDMVAYRWFMPDMERHCVSLLKHKLA
mmetsp:Transcript_33045/g.55307  ORF Transcript_33045/g.55307 Transcript_33045/m.55307 type:complete len:257 (-) Transcript_33045:511-1281(-)|eukprot:CAMPEP_0198225412 /NCGR_PEP_ID=MMETSP1445-20131203/101013_1 /TAXON_ID=36898 /ORGANISM="Pyramimonas sp., Strain CCMP2087" /LENGTH=256 /DNA_ID=CAMNT_0043904927 /DNA_START=250 /DNA_END=1020 /DNA_ORIENTATION=+